MLAGGAEGTVHFTQHNTCTIYYNLYATNVQDNIIVYLVYDNIINRISQINVCKRILRK